MRILSLLLILVTISQSYAYDQIVFSGNGCSNSGTINNVLTISNTGCQAICGTWMKVVAGSSANQYTLSTYSNDQCTMGETGQNPLSCADDNQAFPLSPSSLTAQCVLSTTPAPVPDNWKSYKISNGDSSTNCGASGITLVPTTTSNCIKGCGGSVRISQFSAPSANTRHFESFTSEDCTGTAGSQIFTCGANNVDVNVGTFKVACSTSAPVTTGAATTGTTTSVTTAAATTAAATTTGSASSVVANITLLLVALFFALL